MKRIKICAGIGDNLWLIQKLINADNEFHYIIAGEHPQRGHQIFELLDIGSYEYGPHFSNEPLIHNIQQKHKNYKDIKENEYFVSINTHLELGNRIEEFFPDLKTSWTLDFNTHKYAERAMQLMPSPNCIGFYMSCYASNRAWDYWTIHDWFKLAKMINRTKKHTFIIIGAPYDLDMSSDVMKLMSEHKIPYVNTIGEDLGVVIEIMRKLKYFFSFPSGMGILSTILKRPTTMFYPDLLSKMINAWPNQKLIDNKTYRGLIFEPPEDVYQWVKNEYQLFDRFI